MGDDAMASNASEPAMSGELGKKKRANKYAKLKQCKLDARRKQWLSQVKNNGGKEVFMDASPISASSQRTSNLPRPCQGVLEGRSAVVEALASLDQDGSGLHDSDSESPAQSPSPGGKMRRKGSSCTISSGSSLWSCSRSVSDAEEEREQESRGDEQLGADDWEEVADALPVTADHTKANPDHGNTLVDSKTDDQDFQKNARVNLGRSKPEPNRKLHRAWRPDDAARPHCFPTLSKHRNIQVNRERRYAASGCGQAGILSTPSSCPICVEDFDLTDSRFHPCCCGFRICLFCHKKILEEGDGRCPGCRRPYEQSIGMENGISGMVLSFPSRFSY
ncbi:CCR4-NOT transcription complex subunit 4 [Apostasia shenzhenica]|uniref:CCR4-NOT transcription complex subunit 4 n=1 Tax=Apostasia shenzhenica TaxID=1088818 RepID=A0A2I0ABL0_9ASPA|nr:CCR4-NOT transcription complex subunit 4 [Apostasia shenzhenica]